MYLLTLLTGTGVVYTKESPGTAQVVASARPAYGPSGRR